MAAAPQAEQLAHWRAVYKLAKMWEFVSLTTRSLEHLRKLIRSDPFLMIDLYDTLDVDPEEWLVPAVALLVVRTADLTIEEATQLGFKTVMRVCTLRGEHRVRTNSPHGHRRNIVQRRIRETWGIPEPTSRRVSVIVPSAS